MSSPDERSATMPPSCPGRASGTCPRWRETFAWSMCTGTCSPANCRAASASSISPAAKGTGPRFFRPWQPTSSVWTTRRRSSGTPRSSTTSRTSSSGTAPVRQSRSSDHSVDVVVCFETLEHVLAQDAMLREVQRVLTPDGLLMISSPDRHEYSEVIGNQNPYHVKELDRDEFERLLRSYFPHVALAGQRIRAGSLVGPVDGSTTRFVSFPSGDAVPDAVPGAHAPEYLLASRPPRRSTRCRLDCSMVGRSRGRPISRTFWSRSRASAPSSSPSAWVRRFSSTMPAKT